MSRSWAGGSDWSWRKTRRSVLIRDGYRCRLRLAGCAGTASHVHHTLGRAATGDDPSFLVAACAPCNLHVGSPQGDPAPKPSTLW